MDVQSVKMKSEIADPLLHVRALHCLTGSPPDEHVEGNYSSVQLSERGRFSTHQVKQYMFFNPLSLSQMQYSVYIICIHIFTTTHIPMQSKIKTGRLRPKLILVLVLLF